MTTSPYDVLGLPSDASADQIRQAFRDLAKHYHPDAIGNGGNEAALGMWLQVKEAYELIGDEARRKKYDAVRKILEGNAEPPEGDRYSPNPVYPVYQGYGGYTSRSPSVNFPMTASAMAFVHPPLGSSASFVFTSSASGRMPLRP